MKLFLAIPAIFFSNIIVNKIDIYFSSQMSSLISTVIY